MHIANVERGERSLAVTWTDQSVTEFPFIWLRDNARENFHPDTLERTFDLTTVSADVAPDSVESDGACLHISWPEVAGRSVYDGQWLYAHRPGRRREDPARVGRLTWDAASMPAIPRADARTCDESNAALAGALLDLKRRGLLIIDGLADDAEAGVAFGMQIGFLRETNFGVTFDVVNKPEPNNLAYTSLELPLHTDLPNQELIPGFQFLHCYRSSVDGGESVFADGLKLCDDLKREAPDDFEILSHTAIPWRFHDATADIRRRRPIINLDRKGGFEAFVFNAHIADLPDMPPSVLYEFYPAYQRLMIRMRDPRYVIRYSLSPGEMVAFDNRRVLHGRTAFDATSGDRHLRGYYIEQNEIDSRIRVLSRSNTRRETTQCP
jgi:gamma-butyrobetaine dioxygenase